MTPRKPSPATVLATVALFVALGGAAVAANGDSLLLGKPNTATKQTSLTGAAPNPQLLLENTSTDGNARGVAGLITTRSAGSGSAGVLGATASTDPGSTGVLAQNGGGGPALKAMVIQGAPPLAVNSTTKVANLNADQLDGISSNGFVQGAGSTQFDRLLLSLGGANDNFFVVPGIGGFDADCQSAGSQLLFTVPDGVEGTLTTESTLEGTDVLALTPGLTYAVGASTAVGLVVSTWQIWAADGTRQATVWISLVNQSPNCLFGASALVQTA